MTCHFDASRFLCDGKELVMKKMMLVIDEPENCNDCVLQFVDFCTSKSHRIDVKECNDVRHPDCPLQPMPEVEEVKRKLNEAPLMMFDMAKGSVTPLITLRDYFAGKALSGLTVDPKFTSSFADSAKITYGYADAMLAERASKSEV